LRSSFFLTARAQVKREAERLGRMLSQHRYEFDTPVRPPHPEARAFVHALRRRQDSVTSDLNVDEESYARDDGKRKQDADRRKRTGNVPKEYGGQRGGDGGGSFSKR
jgi:hypothetical protein